MTGKRRRLNKETRDWSFKITFWWLKYKCIATVLRATRACFECATSCCTADDISYI